MNKNQPIHELRLGSLRAAIWQNQTENGLWYNVTIKRLYREQEQWKSTDSFGRDDLLLLSKLIDQAHSWICEHQSSVRTQNESPSGNGD